MTLPLTLRSEAQADLAEAMEWYELQREGLGDDLLLSVEAMLAAIRRFPRSYPEVRNDVRRALIKRFPYGIFYWVEPTRIVVFGIFHAKRDPKSWQRRAGQERP